MFWLIDGIQLDLNNIEFAQIFPYYVKYKDYGETKTVNWLYQFNNIITNPNPEFESKLEVNLINSLDKYLKYTFKLEIKIKGNYISYLDINTNTLYTFLKSEEFIKESDNQFNLPIFSYTYSLISDNKIPNMLDKYYDFNYPEINVDIYKIDLDTLYVIENFKNNIKKYFINKNIDSLTKILN